MREGGQNINIVLFKGLRQKILSAFLKKLLWRLGMVVEEQLQYAI